MTRSTDAALIAQMGAGGGGLDITTSAGGDNMKVRAPDVGDTTDVTGAWPASSSSIAVGDGTTIHNGGDVIAIGDGIDIAPIFTNTDVSDVVAIGDGVVVEVRDDVVAIGDGVACLYPTKPDGSAWANGDAAGDAEWTYGATADAADMVAIGDGAVCVGEADMVAIGDGAVASGMKACIAIGSSVAGIGLDSFGGSGLARLRRVVPDDSCVAIGRAVANGKYSIAVGNAATAGRDVFPAAGDWTGYKPQIGNVAIGYQTKSGTFDADLDEVGSDHNVALGFEAEASGATVAAATAAWPAGGGNVAIGYGAEAHGDNTVALGLGATATYSDSTALGTESEAQAPSATAVGTNARANHNSSTAVGVSATTTADNQIMLGTHFDFVEIPGDSRGGASNGLVLTDTDGSGNRWIIQVTGGVLTVSAAP